MADPRTALKEGEHGSDVRFYNYRGKEVFRVGTKDGLVPKDADKIKNFLEVVPGESGEAPKLLARGEEANIDINLVAKGTGTVNVSAIVADPVIANTINERTTGSGVTADGVLLKDSDVTAVDVNATNATLTGTLAVDTINENSVTAGVTIDGVLLKDNDITATDITATGVTSTNFWANTAVQTDTVNERTPTNGVTVDGVLLKDNDVTATDVNVTNNIFVDTAVQTDDIYERTPAHGVNVDGVLLKDQDVTAVDATLTGTLATDTISEQTATAGVTIDGVLLKDNNVTATDITVEDIYVNGAIKGDISSMVWTTIRGVGNELTQGITGDEEGYDVALSEDGNTLAVGAPQYGNGGVHFYNRDPATNTWSYDTSVSAASFGTSDEGRVVEITPDGNVCISGGNYGRGYVYRRTAGVWGAGTQLSTGTLGVSGDRWGGVGVSDDGTRVIVGDALDNGSQGSVRVWDWNGSSWVFQTDLSQGLASAKESWYQGAAISGDGNTIVTGLPNYLSLVGATAIYTYDPLTSTWDAGQYRKKGTSIQAGEGRSVAVSYDGSTVVSGVYRQYNGGTINGAIIVYERDPDTGVFNTGTFYSGSTTLNQREGNSVHISRDGNTIISGATGYVAASGTGRTFVYVRNDSGTFTLLTSFTNSVAAGGFGSGVSLGFISPERFVVPVGAYNINSAEGGTYIYESTHTGLELQSGNDDIILRVVASETNNVNYPRLEGAVTGNGPTLAAAGEDENIDLNLEGKGTGAVVANTLQSTNITTDTISFDAGTNTLGAYEFDNTWSPAVNYSSNLSSVTVTDGQYQRVGEVIHFQVVITATVTTASTATYVQIDAPTASTSLLSLKTVLGRAKFAWSASDTWEDVYTQWNGGADELNLRSDTTSPAGTGGTGVSIYYQGFYFVSPP